MLQINWHTLLIDWRLTDWLIKICLFTRSAFLCVHVQFGQHTQWFNISYTMYDSIYDKITKYKLNNIEYYYQIKKYFFTFTLQLFSTFMQTGYIFDDFSLSTSVSSFMIYTISLSEGFVWKLICTFNKSKQRDLHDDNCKM